MWEFPNSSHPVLYPHKALKVSFREPSVGPVRWSGLRESICSKKRGQGNWAWKKHLHRCLQLSHEAVLKKNSQTLLRHAQWRTKGTSCTRDMKHSLTWEQWILRVHRGTVKSPSLEIFKIQLGKSSRHPI